VDEQLQDSWQCTTTRANFHPLLPAYFPPVLCSSSDCLSGPPPVPYAGSQNCNSNGPPYSSGSTCVYSCGPGLTAQGALATSCSGGTWSPITGSCVVERECSREALLTAFCHCLKLLVVDLPVPSVRGVPQSSFINQQLAAGWTI
jgi:hypothetical protein